MQLTKMQQLASTLRGNNILVSAGAGSGKTAVLTKRILNLLRDGLRLNEILVLTFTNQATLEMTQRIKKALKKEKMHEHLKDLDGAYIMTFDAFSLSTVRRFHYELGMQSNVTVLDETLLGAVKRNIISAILEERYRTDQGFKDLITDFYGKDDGSFVTALLNIEKAIASRYDKREYLRNYVNEFFTQDKYDSFYSVFRSSMQKKKEEILSLLQGLTFYLEDNQELNRLIHDFTDPEFVFSSSVPSLPTVRNPEYTACKHVVVDELASFWENYVDVSTSFHDYMSAQKYVTIIVSLLEELYDEIEVWCKEKNSYSFSDIAIKAIEAVTSNPHIRNSLATEFKEILIDEYQDTSVLQERFIELISHLNVYMVGDIKQAIYRFRRANPYLFAAKYEIYHNMQKPLLGNNESGWLIDLSVNFRSRTEVIDGINSVFCALMSKEYGDADYALGHQLKFGQSEYSNSDRYNMEIHCYRNDGEHRKAEIEAFAIGKKILELYNSFPLQKNLCQYSDIAILLDRKSDFMLYREIFTFLNIPLNIISDEPLQTSLMFNIIFAFLNLIVTPETETDKFNHYYLSLRRSYLNTFKDEEIFKEIMGEKDSLIYKDVKFLKNYYLDHSPIEVLDYILCNTQIIANIDLIGDAANHLANIEHICKIVSNLSSLGFSLSKAVVMLEDIFAHDIDIRVNTPRNPEGVKLMTIHKSKGLEFPVCFYAGLSSSFNFREINDKFIYDDDLGFVCPLFEEGYYFNFLKTLKQEQYTRAEISEKIRLFYVALTRAKEKIFIITPELKEITSLSKARSFADFLAYVNSCKPLDIHEISVVVSNEYSARRYQEAEFEINGEWVYDIKEFTSKPVIKSRISQGVSNILSKSEKNNISKGIILHSILENMDLANPCWDSVPEEYIEILKKIMSLPVMRKIKSGVYYQEHEFISDIDGLSYHGIIDLLVEYDDHFDIIDYKLANTNKEEYHKQLDIYRQYIKSISEKPVKLYLLSVLKAEITIV